MLWRAPWMQERLALVGLALWDLISVSMSYNLVYWRRVRGAIGRRIRQSHDQSESLKEPCPCGHAGGIRVGPPRPD